jgi:4-diphosphocytidyl-2-C-methyl-D-erythritol kinase
MLPGSLLVNDLEPAARSLRPEIGGALAALREAGADNALVCGSGPTVIGVFWGPDAAAKAEAARGRLGESFPRAFAVMPLRRGVNAPTANPSAIPKPTANPSAIPTPTANP